MPDTPDTRVALVTGGGSGIGRAVVLALVREGYQVVATGRTERALEETVAAAAGPGSAEAVTGDVTRAGSVQQVFTHLARRYGRLDLLVNNAGLFGGGQPVEEVPEQEWRSIVDTNLTGSFLCAQAAFRMMKDQRPQGGRIINNGSISAHAPRPNAVAYTATKHAISGLTKSLSLEGRRWRIACGQIDVGNAQTALTSGMPSGALQADGTVKPEPTMDVEYVANAVVHMAGLPLDANVQFMTIMATAMPYIGRG